MIRRDWVRSMTEQHGAIGYLQIQHGLLEGRAPNGDKIKPISPYEFSIRALWEGLVGPVEETLPYAIAMHGGGGYLEMPTRLEEAMTASAFPSATGQLINAKVIEGYQMTDGFIGDQLVETVPSKLRGERFVGFTALQAPKVVGEDEPYDDSSMADKFVGSRETKRGRILRISEEAVFLDQTGQILSKARGLGEAARQERERRIVRAVIDADSGEAVYAPGGTAEQLYSAGNSNLDAGARPLVDWTDVQEVLSFHATNITDDRAADEALAGQPIVWMPKVLLTATELAGVAARLISATMVTEGATGPRMETGNPLTSLTPGLRPLSSPFIDNATDGDQWDDASDWLLGDFQRQFKYKELWPLQTFRAPANDSDAFNRDTAAAFKVREYGDVISVDERWVIKVNAV